MTADVQDSQPRGAYVLAFPIFGTHRIAYIQVHRPVKCPLYSRNVASDTQGVDNLTPAAPESHPQVARPIPVEVVSVPAHRQKDWNPSVGSFLCLVVGIVLLLVSPVFIFISVPLFLACFVLSIIAMAKHHVASGIIMMILVLTAPPICILGVFAVAVSKGVQKVDEDKRAAIANLVFEDISGSRNGSYMYLKGRVRNNGTTAADFVKVQVNWLDKQGTILDTGETFVVDLEKLQPGAAKSFEIMTPTNPKMARYSYKFASN